MDLRGRAEAFLKICGPSFDRNYKRVSRSMDSNIGSGTGTVHLIEHALAVADSQAALARLRAAISAASPAEPLGLELTGDTPTTPALQLLLAAERGLTTAGGFSGFGPHAAAVLSALCVPTPEQC